MSKLLARLRDPARAGVYRARAADDIEQATRGSELDVVTIDAAGELFAAIAGTLGFPSWFGANWDALEDSLSDLSWRARDGYLLIFRGYPGGESCVMLVDVLRSAAQYWAERGKPFFAVFIDPEKKLELPELYRGA
ncbi:MAG: barstar family protein [Betaproteobacteria bacterium]|nr:barstar family protein [Betaproteobacteria bacterium]